MSQDPSPRFSVVVPLHNKARYIGGTLSSVLAQSFRDFEVVVVDNGSTDDGPAIVEGLQRWDRRIRLVRQANAGVSMARNRGIDEARGEWVAFLDADDWQHPDYLACLAAVLQAQPRAEALATRFIEFTDDGGAPPPWEVASGAPAVELITDLPARWMRGASFFTGSLAVRRDRLLAMQPCFPPGESWGEDLDLFFRVAEQTPIALAHAPLVAYRKGVSGSLTDAGRPREMPPWVHRLRARTATMPPALRASTLALIAQFEIDMARHALAEGRRAHGLRWLVRALPAGARSRRWFTTAAMALLPDTAVRTSLEQIRRRALAAAAQAPAASSSRTSSWRGSTASSLGSVRASLASRTNRSSVVSEATSSETEPPPGYAGLSASPAAPSTSAGSHSATTAISRTHSASLQPSDG
jgi:GT2 family glycosyltransferase